MEVHGRRRDAQAKERLEAVVVLGVALRGDARVGEGEVVEGQVGEGGRGGEGEGCEGVEEAEGAREEDVRRVGLGVAGGDGRE